MSNKLVISTILLLFISFNTFSQCKGFTKRKCLPELAPFNSNGQLNSAQLFPSDNAEITLSLNKGITYRLLVCSDPYLEKLEYKVLDQNNSELFSDSLSNYSSFKDLKVKESQNVKMQIKIPPKENTTGIKRSGCVTVMLGYKE